MTTETVYEIVVYKAKDGISAEQVIESAQSIQPLLENYPGYISRELIQTEDDQWVDLVTWESLADAHHAAEDIMKHPEAEMMMAVIEAESINMMHGMPAYTTKKAQVAK